MQATHEQQMAALGQHYQRALLDLTTYLRAQISGAQQVELPPSLFAPPPIPPFPALISILPVALACAGILHVLMRSLVLYVGTVSGFEPDSRCQLSTGPFSTARVPGLPHLPDTAVPLADADLPAATGVLVPTSTDATGVLVSASTAAAGALRACKCLSSELLACRLVSVGGGGSRAPRDDRST